MLAAAGNTYEQTIAMLTAANTTVQDISKSSTGLRTIAARIRKTKSELDDLGEAMTEAEYDDLVNALTEYNVKITDVNGEFRSTYDIIKDIAAIWDTLDSKSQAALTEKLAGTRQQNVFTSLVKQFQEAEGSMTSMTDSAGALSSAYDVYMNTTQAHIDQLKASFTELSMTIFDSESTKGVIDFLNSVIQFLNTIIEHFGLLSTAIAGVGIYKFIKNFD